MKKYNLNDTLKYLEGPSKENIIDKNQCAALALGLYHKNSTTSIKFKVDNNDFDEVLLEWDDTFPKGGWVEPKNIAEQGSVALGFFLMSILKDYRYVIQTIQGTGVDYLFKKNKPDEDNLNFLEIKCDEGDHYVEISGILEETSSNTVAKRLKFKHQQISKGSRCSSPSSVIITLFKVPLTIKEIHSL